MGETLCYWSSSVKRSIVIAVIISILVPVLPLFVLDFYFAILDSFYAEIPSNLHNKLLFLQDPAFIEVNLLAESLLWFIVRFIPIIALAYVNGKILEKLGENLRHRNLYLIATSVIVYALSLGLGALIFILMFKVPGLKTLLVTFDFFSI